MIFFEADYEAHQPLGLLLQACKVTYSIGNHGQPTIVACCVVFDPTKNTGINRGDVLVSVNGLALIDPDHDISDENQLDVVKSRLTAHTHLPRTLRFFRHSGAEFDERNVGAWYDSTVLTMTAEEAALIDEYGSNNSTNNHEMSRFEDDYEQGLCFFESDPSCGTIYTIDIPSKQRSLGLDIEARQLAYTDDSGNRNVIDCSVVKESFITTKIKSGDLIIKINGRRIVSDRVKPSNGEVELQQYFDWVLKMLVEAKAPRSITLLRPAGDAEASSSGSNHPSISCACMQSCQLTTLHHHRIHSCIDHFF